MVPSLRIRYVMIYGSSMGGTATLQATAVGVCFGRLHYGSIAGRIVPFVVVMQALTVPLVGLVRDVLGSYIVALVAVMVANLVGVACIRGLDSGARPPMDA
jgi:hypothetical protein